MSGLLALLDDVAAIAKVAAASVDDIAAAATKAGVKAAGVVIDDAAVTPKYVHGFEADRELPIIWRIALGSMKNKLIFLLPGLLALPRVEHRGRNDAGDIMVVDLAQGRLHVVVRRGLGHHELDELRRLLG